MALGDISGRPSSDWLDSILQTILLNSPDYAGLKGRALSAPGNLATSANAPVTAGVGPEAAASAAGTGPTITASPTPTVAAAPAATAAPAGTPAAAATPAGQAGAPTPPVSSASAAPAKPAAPAAPAPALNARTVNEVWRAMAERGAQGGGSSTGDRSIDVSGGGGSVGREVGLGQG